MIFWAKDQWPYTVWIVRLWKKFCKMFSMISLGRIAAAVLPKQAGETFMKQYTTWRPRLYNSDLINVRILKSNSQIKGSSKLMCNSQFYKSRALDLNLLQFKSQFFGIFLILFLPRVLVPIRVHDRPPPELDDDAPEGGVADRSYPPLKRTEWRRRRNMKDTLNDLPSQFEVPVDSLRPICQP